MNNTVTKYSVLIKKGLAAAERGNKNSAKKHLVQALRLNPKSDIALNALGLIALEVHSYLGAVKYFARAIEISPNNSYFLNNYGVALSLSGNSKDAIPYLQKSCYLSPTNSHMALDLANAFIRNGEIENALKETSQLIGADIDQGLVYLVLGRAQRLLGQYDDAETSLDMAFELNPCLLEALRELANTKMEVGQPKEALEIIDRALERDDQSGKNFRIKAQILRQLGQFNLATIAAEKAFAASPNIPEVQLTLAICLLTSGHLSEGWKHYGARWETFPANKVYPLAERTWDGKRLRGKSLLVRSEQGLGDEILFSTCLNDLISATNGERVMIECDPRLVKLFSRTYPQLTFMRRPSPDKGEPRTQGYDLEIGFGSLPSIFRQSVEEIYQKTAPKLAVDPCKKAFWENQFLKLGGGLKIGVAWRGGAVPVAKLGRSFHLHEWLPILQVPDCHFINLQYGDCREELNTFMQNNNVSLHNYPEVDPLVDIESQAAQISALDLVVQTSNTSAHIAGAIGLPTWVLQAPSPYWPWFLGCDDMPWYSNVSQFRITLDEERSATIKHVAELLKKYVQTHIGRTND